MTTPNQKATLERMLFLSVGIYFDGYEGAFSLISSINNEPIAEVHPQTACSLIKGKYIQSEEATPTSFHLTSKGLAEARRAG